MKFYQIIKLLKDKKGEGYIDMAVFAFIIIFMMVFFTSVIPIFTTKLSLDTYAHELIREAEIAGNIGTETAHRLQRLDEIKGLYPNVAWSNSGHIQIGGDITVTVSKTVDFSFFIFHGWVIEIKSTATGKSEVYWRA